MGKQISPTQYLWHLCLYTFLSILVCMFNFGLCQLHFLFVILLVRVVLKWQNLFVFMPSHFQQITIWNISTLIVLFIYCIFLLVVYLRFNEFTVYQDCTGRLHAFYVNVNMKRICILTIQTYLFCLVVCLLGCCFVVVVVVFKVKELHHIWEKWNSTLQKTLPPWHSPHFSMGFNKSLWTLTHMAQLNVLKKSMFLHIEHKLLV